MPTYRTFLRHFFLWIIPNKVSFIGQFYRIATERKPIYQSRTILQFTLCSAINFAISIHSSAVMFFGHNWAYLRWNHQIIVLQGARSQSTTNKVPQSYNQLEIPPGTHTHTNTSRPALSWKKMICKFMLIYARGCMLRCSVYTLMPGGPGGP